MINYCSLFSSKESFFIELSKLPSKIKGTIRSLTTKEKVMLAAAMIFAAAISFFGRIGLIMGLVTLAGCNVFRHLIFRKAKSLFSNSGIPNLKTGSKEKTATALSKVHLFQGDQVYKGICMESLEAMEKLTKNLFVDRNVVRCPSDQLKVSKWQRNDLLILPGGKCSDWDELLSEKKKIKIYNWFKNGGRILGICAGGYYCAESSEYATSKTEKLFRLRQISLFSGKCYGPAYSPQLKIVKVKWIKSQKEGYVALIGGGFFIPNANNQSDDYTALAEYAELPHRGKIAVVMCCKGNGKSILSGPHWEFDQEHLKNLNCFFSQRILEQMQKKLEESANFRNHCSREMLKMLLA